MFEVNDYAVIKNCGICRITDIQQSPYPVTAESELCYTLCPVLHPEETIHVPVQSSLVARRAVKREEAMEILDRIPYIRTIKAPKERIRNEFYAEAMNEYDCVEWIKVIKSVYIRQRDGSLSGEELAFASEAKEYFHSEVSIALSIPYSEVESYITHYVKTCT